MILFIYLCILVLNVVAFFMTYRFLGPDIEKKEKLIFIIIGFAIMYIAVTAVYVLSSKGIEISSNTDLGKNFITFCFVPLNCILVLPFLASSYKYLKAGLLRPDKFRNRCILIAVCLTIILVIEFFYFKDIQLGIVEIVKSIKK